MRRLEFDLQAVEDLRYFVRLDRRKTERILRMAEETLSDPFGGIGKPEPLKNELSGLWSKRVDDEHSMIYEVSEEKTRILSCRGRY